VLNLNEIIGLSTRTDKLYSTSNRGLATKMHIRHSLSFILLILGVSPMASTMVIAQPSLDSLDDLRWSHRIILFRDSVDPTLSAKEFEKLNAEIIDRDILWFAFDNQNISTNYTGVLADPFLENIQQRYFRDERTALVLIGKDGGVKDASNLLDLPRIFALIDGMPMRRAEMRESAPK